MFKINFTTKIIGYQILGFVFASALGSAITNFILQQIAVETKNSELAMKGVITALLVLATYTFINTKLKQKNLNAGVSLSRSNIKIALASVGAMALVITILYSFGYYQIVSHQTNSQLVVVLFALLAQAITQEVLFRGILFKQFARIYPVAYVVVVISLLLAMLNILVDGPYLQPFMATLLMDLVLCLLYQINNNIFLSTIANTGWLYLTFLTGVLDEHWRTSAPIITQTQGNSLLSGGVFGPESSLFGLLVLSLVAIWLFKLNKLTWTTRQQS